MRLGNDTLWDKCAAFHGHVCGGLFIGYTAALYAAELLDLTFSHDEQVVCIAENDACGVDAIQVVLGCSVGKGNLLFHMTGKQAFSFYNRAAGRSVRLVLAKKPEAADCADVLKYYRACAPEEMLHIKETSIALPERARISGSYACERCGETAASGWIRLQDGKKLCVDCFAGYDRFNL